MATIYAIANGNWSDSSTWSTGTVPTVDDDVWLNGHTVSVNQNDTITAALISNLQDSGIGVVEGGYIYNNQAFNVNNIITINANINSKNNIVNVNCGIKVNGDVHSLTTVPTSNNQYRQNATFYIQSGTAYNLPLTLELNGNLYTDDNSVGVVQCSGHTSGYQNIAINGDIYHNGGYICNYFSYATSQRFAHITGNIYAKTNLMVSSFIADSGYITYGPFIITGDWLQISGPVRYGQAKHIGDLTVEQNAYLDVYGNGLNFENTGTITVKTDNSVYGYVLRLYPNANSGTIPFKIHNFVNLSNCNKFFSDFNYPSVNTKIVISGEFHTGSPQMLIDSTLGYSIPMGIIELLPGAKIYYTFSNPLILAKKWEINTDDFEFIYEGDPLYAPNFKVVSLVGLQYPQESDVKDGVIYGPNYEYTGTYQINYPQEANVLEGVEYGDGYVGTLSPVQGTIVESGTVVNLTQDQIRRVAESVTAEMAQTMLQQYFG